MLQSAIVESKDSGADIIPRNLMRVLAAALALRLVLLAFVVRFPGVADPNHYYNLGARLAEGHGYTIPYIWQYNDVYAAVEHPDDYWMPVTAGLAAGGMSLFGVGLPGALAAFILLGVLLPLVTYAAARQFGLAEGTAVGMAAAAAFLPEFVLNSVRTDTTIPNAVALGAAVIAFTHGMRTGQRWPFWCSGAAVGIAYLIRSESALILPALAASVIVYTVLDRTSVRWRVVIPGLLGAGVIALIIALPWVVRTLALNGTFSTPTTGNMFFLTDYRDHYRFDTRLTLDSYLAAQTPAQIIGKRVFEIAATGKLVITTFDALLLPLVGGAALLVAGLWRKDRDAQRWQAIAPALIVLAGFTVFYTILVPFKSQGGSMKKALLSVVPLLIPLAGYALERAIPDARLRAGALIAAAALLALNGVELTRQDNAASAAYLADIETMAAAARALPDQTGDGALVFMTQDPFILGYAGLSSVVYPHPDRATVIAVAARYGVDYLLMPSDRPELDRLIDDPALDPRFVPAADVPGTAFTFWRIRPSNTAAAGIR
ncbi:MAG: glycosyltransferase family 39 protein [bacterium]|nr:glycosyltransferase family 39 protein [bacterium]